MTKTMTNSGKGAWLECDAMVGAGVADRDVKHMNLTEAENVAAVAVVDTRLPTRYNHM